MNPQVFPPQILDSIEKFIKSVMQDAPITRGRIFPDEVYEERDSLQVFFEAYFTHFCEGALKLKQRSLAQMQGDFSLVSSANPPRFSAEVIEIARLSRRILHHWRDWVHDDYVQNPAEFEKFLHDHVPEFLRAASAYSAVLGDTSLSERFSKLESQWKVVFCGE